MLVNVGGSFSSLGKSDAGATDGPAGVVTIDTWQPPAADAAALDNSVDAGMGQPDVIWWDTVEAAGSGPVDAGGLDGEAPLDDAQGDDYAVGDGYDDGFEDVEDGEETEDVVGPLPDVDLPPVDSGGPSEDTIGVDAGDSVAGVTDSLASDAGGSDSGTDPPDAGLPDIVNGAEVDAGPGADAPEVDVPDIMVDGGLSDTQADSSDGGDVADPKDIVDAAEVFDAPWDPDWSGYGDVTFPPDVDVHGGVLDSCWSLYGIVFEETCTDKDLTVSCVDSASALGSVWAQHLFKPLRKCMVANCIPKCTGPKSKDCLEQCRGKNCAYPLFACASEGESGKSDCQATFSCMQKYDNKFFSMAFYCFGNASPAAKKQMAEFFACGTEPQTDGCLDQIAACYGPAGKATCKETIECSNKCPQPDNDTCFFDCIGKVDADGLKKLDTLWDCIIEKCNGQGEACIGQKCQLEAADCFNDKPGAP